MFDARARSAILAACSPDLLRRFEPFAALEWTTLCSVARHARLLRLRGATHAGAERSQTPRQLLSRERRSCGGATKRRPRSADRRSGRGSAPRVCSLSGDGASVETIGAVTLLWIDLDPVAFMLGADTAGYAVERLDAAPDDHWMHRFLGPGLVECLAAECVADGVSRIRAAASSKPAKPSCAKANRPICSTSSPTDRRGASRSSPARGADAGRFVRCRRAGQRQPTQRDASSCCATGA